MTHEYMEENEEDSESAEESESREEWEIDESKDKIEYEQNEDELERREKRTKHEIKDALCRLHDGWQWFFVLLKCEERDNMT